MTRIIAEFCQNHNGDFDLLARMIEEASKAGATHGKMQTIYADTLQFRAQFEVGLCDDEVVKSIRRPYLEEYKRLKSLEISIPETERFIQLCYDNGIVPMTTCFARGHVPQLADMGFKSIKIASYDCSSFPLLRDVANCFDEIVVSTGATFDDEVIHAADILSSTNFAFLHCVTIYPTKLHQMHMVRMEWLRKFTKAVGYSDHSSISETGLLASKAALALGADLIERHFTLLETNETKDGPVSINPKELNELVKFSKLDIEERLSIMDLEYPGWKVVMGEKNRQLSDMELLNRDYYRGRFATPRGESIAGTRMICNWEETPLS